MSRATDRKTVFSPCRDISGAKKNMPLPDARSPLTLYPLAAENRKNRKKCVFEVDYFEKGSIVLAETNITASEDTSRRGNRPGIHPGAN
jgi:hypothetical protein